MFLRNLKINSMKLVIEIHKCANYKLYINKKIRNVSEGVNIIQR